MTKIDYDNIEKLHIVGRKGATDILIKHGTFKKLPFFLCLLISLTMSIILLASNSNTFNVLRISADIIKSVFPGLLGFSLGGYAIAVGFSNTDLIKESTGTTKHNIYQILSAIFALSIFVQAITTIVGVIIYWCVNVNINSALHVPISFLLSQIINSIILFFLFFTSLYSLVLIPYVVINLFTLSQLNSLYYTVEKLKADNKPPTEP